MRKYGEMKPGNKRGYVLMLTLVILCVMGTMAVSFIVISTQDYAVAKAEKHGESINDTVIKTVENLIAGVSPSPQPAPSPEPAPGPVTPERFKKLEAKEEETRKGVEWLAEQIEGIPEKVNELLGIFPGGAEA